MNLIINDENLEINEVDELNSKVRVILMDEENRVLIANYGGVILFPGGSIDNGENISQAIIRELCEETGVIYEEADLTFLTQLDFFQRNYIKRNGAKKNRLVKTSYFYGIYKSVELESQCLTEKEEKDGFKLQLVPLKKLEKFVLENQNDNPRNIYFQREMVEITKLYMNLFGIKNQKKLIKENVTFLL